MGSRWHERCPIRKAHILVRYEEEDGTTHMLQREFAVGRDGVTALTIDVSETKHKVTDIQRMRSLTTPLQYFVMVAAYDRDTNSAPLPMIIDPEEEG